MRFGLPRTYAPYATTPWGAVRAKLGALLGGPAARQRQQQPVRTDGPMVGREARWLGDDLLPIPVGTMGTVTGWKPAGEERCYFVEFGPDDGGWTVTTSLPSPEIELV
jgi:hypothetical protein